MAADEPDMAEELLSAAAHYRKAFEYASALWAHVSMDDAGVQKFSDSGIRAIFADHALRARDLEQEAVSSIETLLERVGR